MTKNTDYCEIFDPTTTVYIIDGSSFLYRAYYSLRPLHTTSGAPVQAVFSFCRMIKHWIDKFRPIHVVLVWDSKGKTLRHEIYADYKATRQAPPSDLYDQKQRIMNFADIVGIRQLIKDGIEADDLMYSLAQELKNSTYKTVLITSDKDLLQALSAYIFVYDPFKDTIIDPTSFQETMGFPVSQLAFYHALVGDSSDNIPGVHGIGKKGAADLVAHYQSLIDLYNNIHTVKPDRVRNALIAHKDDAFLSEQLFTLRYVPTNIALSDTIFDSKNWSKAGNFFTSLNFKSLLKDIPQEDGTSTDGQLSLFPGTPKAIPAAKSITYDSKLVTTVEDLKDLCQQIRQTGICALDTETDGLAPLVNHCVGISLCCHQGVAWYIPFGHKTGEPQLTERQVLDILKPLLEDPGIQKYLHNAKFDALVLDHAGIKLKGIAFDSYIVARLLLREWQKAGLKPLSEFYFNEPMATFDEIIGIFKVKNFSYVPLSQAAHYASCDAHQTYRLAQFLRNELAQEPVIEKLYYEIEHPMVEILIAMEAEGIVLDIEQLKKLGTQVEGSLAAVELTIKDLVGRSDINLNSPRQVEDLLFNQLGLPSQKKSAKGKYYSTDQEVLKALMPLHPVPGLIAQFRELAKLKGTYIDTLPTYVNPRTGRIHTTFNQVTTATGRLASLDPNLQNIPTGETGYGLAIRDAFKPKQGHIFIAADYSQIELRVLAHLSQDINLKTAFALEQDIHAQTAARIFQVPVEQVTHTQRQLGKLINFSILYGKTPYGLSKELGISQKDAKNYIENYFAQYPGVLVWMETVINEVTAHGYVTTLWGRRRYIPTIFEKNRVLHDEAKRIAINTKVQGTAADIMKLGMIKITQEFKQNNLDAAIILQIHDEIVVTADIKSASHVEQLIARTLETVVAWDVPLKVTTRSGTTWKNVTK
jgi:DNA polymerase I